MKILQTCEIYQLNQNNNNLKNFIHLFQYPSQITYNLHLDSLDL